jgi:hypothetical protein
MATAKNKTTSETETNAVETETVVEKKDVRVPLDIPRGQANDEPNVFISVNGVGFLLPKGKRSMVPPYVKAEYERSVAAQNKMDEHVGELLEAANKPLPGTV